MQALVAKGYTQGQTGNATAQSQTQVLYGPGSAANASAIASLFGVTAEPSSAVSSGTVEVVLGSASTVPGSLTGSSGSAGSSGFSGSSGGVAPSAQATLPGNATSVQQAQKNNGTNAPLKVAGNARYGIPCVY
jgi:hypothetical protein